jgi:hypothetical protein
MGLGLGLTEIASYIDEPHLVWELTKELLRTMVIPKEDMPTRKLHFRNISSKAKNSAPRFF